MTASEQEQSEPDNSEDEVVLPGTGLPPDTDDRKGASQKEKPARKHSRGAPPRARGQGLLWLLVCLLILAGGYGVYYYEERLAAQSQRLAAVESTLDATIDRTRRESQTLSSSYDALVDQVSALSETQKSLLEELALRLDRLSRRVSQITLDDRAHWILAESRYLVRQANVLARGQHDVQAVQAYLESADRLLAELDDPAVTAVREALLADIQTLRGLPVPDRQGIFLALSELLDASADWTLARDHVAQYRQAQDADTAAAGWRGVLDRLEGLVTVSRGEPPEPMLPPEQAWFLREQVRLALEQAQWAALRQVPAAYTDSLDRADRWLSAYFSETDPTVVSARATLQSLRERPVATPDVDLTRSTRALLDYIRAREKRFQQPAVLQPLSPATETGRE